ncbi:MAG: hypothetical protein ACRYF2_09520 [Janthinobacterium lividum]
MMRPIVRPIMRRLRLFFIGALHDEIRELRAELRLLKTLVERQHSQPIETVIDQRTRHIMAQALATLALDRDSRDQESEDFPFST